MEKKKHKYYTEDVSVAYHFIHNDGWEYKIEVIENETIVEYGEMKDGKMVWKECFRLSSFVDVVLCKKIIELREVSIQKNNSNNWLEG